MAAILALIFKDPIDGEEILLNHDDSTVVHDNYINARGWRLF